MTDDPKVSLLLIDFPLIASEWHPTKNEGVELKGIRSYASKNVWWKCSKGHDHEWRTSISERTRRRSGCPFCSGRRADSKNNLKVLRPELAKEWHPDKNGERLPEHFKAGSHAKVWWKCPHGPDHEWEATIGSRAGGNGCPFCANKKVSITNSLASKFPEIAGQLHPSKNGGLTAEELVWGSNKKVWWKCDIDVDHEWQTTVNSRTGGGHGCPHCTGRMANSKENLVRTDPDIASQWHPTMNNNLKPEDFKAGSGAKVWWQCPESNDHVWESVINSRTREVGRGCPFCSGRYATSERNLSSEFPKIAAQWHPTKNGVLTPEEVTPSSGKKVWWQCPVSLDHEWRQKIAYRTDTDSACPYCEGHQAASDNNLALKRPDLAAEWHPEKNGEKLPTQYTEKNWHAVWWKCANGGDHEWRARISARALRNQGCPYCSGHKLSITNSLKTCFPDVAAELHATKNGAITAEGLMSGSGKHVWWQCSRDPHHEWRAPVSRRTLQKSGCPHCVAKTSHPEIRIYAEMLGLFGDVKNRARVAGVEVDIYLSDLRIGIEYDGFYWHQNKVEKDLAKTQKLAKKHISLIRVREHGLGLTSPNDIAVSTPLEKADLNRLVLKIHEIAPEKADFDVETYVACDGFTQEDLFKKYVSYLPDPFPEHSAAERSEILTFWDYDKNHPLTPANFTAFSNRRVWWRCSEGDDHFWEGQISQLTGCPFCAGRRLSKDNNLAAMYPSLAKQWHPTKNFPLTADKVFGRSTKKFWWLCSEQPGHEWQDSCSRRVRGFSGCPMCKSIKTKYSEP